MSCWEPLFSLLHLYQHYCSPWAVYFSQYTVGGGHSSLFLNSFYEFSFQDRVLLEFQNVQNSYYVLGILTCKSYFDPFNNSWRREWLSSPSFPVALEGHESVELEFTLRPHTFNWNQLLFDSTLATSFPICLGNLREILWRLGKRTLWWYPLMSYVKSSLTEIKGCGLCWVVDRPDEWAQADSQGKEPTDQSGEMTGIWKMTEKRNLDISQGKLHLLTASKRSL